MTVERPTRALGFLSGLRARQRRLRNLEGVFRFGTLLALIVWATFLLDWSLDLPRAVRILLWVASLGLFITTLSFFFQGSRRRLGNGPLAAVVEAREPGFAESLVTAVELTDPRNPRSALYSPALLARSVADAEARAAQLRPSTFLSPRRLIGAVVVGGGLMAALALVGSNRPDLARTYMERNLFFSNVPWPREHDFDIVEPNSAEVLLAMGEPFSVVARQIRGAATRVQIHAEFVDGERETFGLERKGFDEYRKHFSNTSRGFSFVVEGGDFTSSRYVVEVRNRPRVERIELTFDYPEYTDLEDVTTPTADLGGHIKVPVGTVVRYFVDTSIPVASAAFHYVWKEGAEERTSEQPLAIGEGQRLEGDFLAENPGFYFFTLGSTDGFENPNPIRYRVALVHDRSPAVQIVAPGKNREVSARARFPIRLEATDDYGIVESALVFRTAGAGGDAERVERIVLWPGAELGANSVTDESLTSGTVLDRTTGVGMALEHPLDLETWGADVRGLPVVAGGRIEYHAEATDALGQVGSSRVYVLTVIREEDLARMIQDELSLIRERLEQTLRAVVENEKGLSVLLDEANLSEGPLPAVRAAAVRQVRLKEERIHGRIEDAEQSFTDIVARIIDNRLEGDVKELPWIENMRERVRGILTEESSEALTLLSEASQKAAAGTAGSPELDPALEAIRRLRKALAEVVGELGEWGDIRTMIRKLEDLIRVEQELEKQIEDHIKKQ